MYSILAQFFSWNWDLHSLPAKIFTWKHDFFAGNRATSNSNTIIMVKRKIFYLQQLRLNSKESIFWTSLFLQSWSFNEAYFFQLFILFDQQLIFFHVSMSIQNRILLVLSPCIGIWDIFLVKIIIWKYDSLTRNLSFISIDVAITTNQNIDYFLLSQPSHKPKRCFNSSKLINKKKIENTTWYFIVVA